MYMNYAKLSDQALEAERLVLPKYTNDCTPDQLADMHSIYTEQTRRYKTKISQYNEEATKATGLKHGDRVSYFATGLFGLGGETYTGKIIHDKTGRLAVKLDHADGSGKKIIPLNKGFKKL